MRCGQLGAEVFLRVFPEAGRPECECATPRAEFSSPDGEIVEESLSVEAGSIHTP